MQNSFSRRWKMHYGRGINLIQWPDKERHWKKKTSVDEVEHRLARDEVRWLTENFLNVSEEHILNDILEWNRLKIVMHFHLNIERQYQIRKKITFCGGIEY